MFKVLLWDIDGTLLDFKAAEKAAFFKCFEVIGLSGCNDEMLERYSKINHTYWQRLERNEITKQDVLVGRYIEFFTRELELSKKGMSLFKLPESEKYVSSPMKCLNLEQMKSLSMNSEQKKSLNMDSEQEKYISMDVKLTEQEIIEKIAIAFNDEYQIRLGDTAIFCDGADQLVRDLKGKYKQYIVTNGTAIAQHRKLKTSGLEHLVDGWFISDEIGIEKPNVGFFDAVWAKIGNFQKNEVLIIGDSLTSDMKGGNNANITTCWYNPNHLEKNTDIQVDYEIANLQDLYEIL